MKKPQFKKIILSLYVAGSTAQSREAIMQIKKILKKNLPETFKLSIIDIYQQPHLAKQHQIIAVPTLIKEAPTPVRLFIGDLSQADSIFSGLAAA